MGRFALSMLLFTASISALEEKLEKLLLDEEEFLISDDSRILGSLKIKNECTGGITSGSIVTFFSFSDPSCIIV